MRPTSSNLAPLDIRLATAYRRALNSQAWTALDDDESVNEMSHSDLYYKWTTIIARRNRVKGFTLLQYHRLRDDRHQFCGN